MSSSPIERYMPRSPAAGGEFRSSDVAADDEVTRRRGFCACEGDCLAHLQWCVTYGPFDDQRAVDRNLELRRRLDSVALPLGVELSAHEDIRVFGFPELNNADFATAHTEKVNTTEFRIGENLAAVVQISAFGTRFSEHPKGMSGGPLARTYPGGRERVVGIISVFPSAGPDGRAALGGALVCRRIEDLQQVFPAVAAAVRRSTHLSDNRLPVAETELSLDVIEASRPDFESAGIPLPRRFTLDELSLVDPLKSRSRLADRIYSLRSAVVAKHLLLGIGVANLEIGRLQVGGASAIYHLGGIQDSRAAIDHPHDTRSYYCDHHQRAGRRKITRLGEWCGS